MTTPQNLIEKIIQCYAVNLPEGHLVQAGDYVTIRPAHVLTHDNTGAVMQKFKAMGARRMSDPRQPVFVLDHNIQDKSDANLKKYAAIEAFAQDMGVDFYPAGRGIGHQVLCEEGYVWPGTLVVASDSHSNMYGGLGCLGTPVVRTDAAAIWAAGCTWWQVPPVAQVRLTGRLASGVTGKDVIITLCGLFNHDEVLNHAVEFSGDGASALSIEERLTIANMTTEWGALAGVFPVDEVTLRWLRDRITAADSGHPRLNAHRLTDLDSDPVVADPDAHYAKKLTLDLSTVSPQVSGPDHVKAMTSAAALSRQQIAIHKAYLVSCVNSRVEDLAEAARIVGDCKVAAGVEFYIAAASSAVQAESERRGDWQVLLDTGAIPLPPGCGPCIGLGAGLLEDGEVGISATNRNFKGRMGSRNAETFLASPAVVAASALAGRITPPEHHREVEPKGSVKIFERPPAPGVPQVLLPGFPEELEGELIFCDQDNLDTDGIYPGKYTYMDTFTPKQQAAVVMENYDPAFGELAREGDILVAGYNFGTGSSREQAATALMHRGIRLVLAGSVSVTYRRNALNNGFLVLAIPDLVDDLRTRIQPKTPTVRTGWTARIDFVRSELAVDGRRYKFSALGPVTQELIVSGGLGTWVKERMEDR